VYKKFETTSERTPEIVIGRHQGKCKSIWFYCERKPVVWSHLKQIGTPHNYYTVACTNWWFPVWSLWCASKWNVRLSRDVGTIIVSKKLPCIKQITSLYFS